MKKLISLALTLAILATLTIGASAGFVVGNRTGAGYKEGATADAFNTVTPSTDISITVSAGAVQSRYAVDITYDTMDFSLSGTNLVWDVNTLKYVVADPNDPNVTGTAKLEDKTFNVKVTNFSDQPVYLNASIEDKKPTNGDNDGVTVATVTENGTFEDLFDLATTAVKINDAVGTTEGSATSFGVNVHAANWTDVANYYADILTTANAKEVLATLTITIAKNA